MYSFCLGPISFLFLPFLCVLFLCRITTYTSAHTHTRAHTFFFSFHFYIHNKHRPKNTTHLYLEYCNMFLRSNCRCSLSVTATAATTSLTNVTGLLFFSAAIPPLLCIISNLVSLANKTKKATTESKQLWFNLNHYSLTHSFIYGTNKKYRHTQAYNASLAFGIWMEKKNEVKIWIYMIGCWCMRILYTCVIRRLTLNQTKSK